MILFLSIYPRVFETFFHTKKTCTRMFIVTLFIITKIWIQPKCPLTGEWINNMYYIRTIQYYSVIRRNEALIDATTWMIIEDFMQSENSQTPRPQILKFHSYEISRIDKCSCTENRSDQWLRGDIG